MEKNNAARRYQLAVVALALTVAMAIGGGLVAWGQTKEKVEQLRTRQDASDETIGDVRREQEKNSRVLGAIEERTQMMQQTQQRILDELTRIRTPPPQ